MTTPPVPKIRLQAVGWVPAVPASELREGDFLMWNFGWVSEIVSIEQASPKFLLITTRTVFDGYTRVADSKSATRRIKASSLMARTSDPFAKEGN